MSPQASVLVSYGVTVVIIAAIFIIVAASSRRTESGYDQIQLRGYALRRVWFWVLVVSAITAFALTVRAVPYGPKVGYEDAMRIPVVARQYSFGGLPDVIPYNTPVIFEVTASDVNHGFAIFNPDNEIVAQVQAMPLYTNELLVTFTKRGQYTVLCLEYCGISHHNMRASFEVR